MSDLLEARAERILDSAATLLLRWGYRRITMEDVAQQASIGTGTLYLHWTTKAALFETVLLRELLGQWSALEQALEADPTAVVLHRFLGSLLQAIHQRPLAHALFVRDTTLLGVLAQAGQRGVLARGWGGLAPHDLPDTAYMVDEVPHAWLFPQMAAVVHHGGAGTTAAGLRAGKPSVVCPFLGDQPFWGRVVHERGLGPRPIPQRRLTAPRLAAAIRAAIADSAQRERAAALGAQIRAEDGVGQAVAIVERLIEAPASVPSVTAAQA